jgi:hypothetical protein
MKNTFLAQAFIFGLTSLIPAIPVLAKQTCIRMENGQVACGKPVPNNIPSTKKPVNQKSMVQSQSGLSFTLNGCQKSRDGLVCVIAIQNTTDYDKNVYVNTNYSMLMDSEGNQYNLSNSTFVTTKTLPPKLKITTKMLFRPSGNLSDYIRMLKISGQIEGRSFTVAFRDFNVN